jgi:WD40 repeat protein
MWNGGLDLWDAATAKHIQELVVDSNRKAGTDTVAFSSGGQLVGVSTQSAKTLIYEAGPWKLAAVLGDVGVTPSLAFDPMGRFVVAARTGRMELWSTASWERQWSVTTRPGRGPGFFMDESERLAQLWTMVWQVAFSPDGTKIASATDGYVQVWDVQSRRELSYTQTGGRPGSLAFGGDSQYLGWGNWNEEIRIWRVGSGRPRVLKVDSTLGRAAFSQDLSRIAVPDGRMTIKIIEIPSGKLLRSIRCAD